MFSRIVSVCLSPTVDVTVNIDSLSSNEPNIVKNERYDAGGKGVNIAKILKSYGVDCTLIYPVGEDNADVFSRLLGEHIKSDYVVTSGRVRENISVITDDARNFKIDRVANSLEPADKEEIIKLCGKYSHDDGIIIFSGSLPRGMTEDDFCEFVMQAGAGYGYIALDCAAITKKMIERIRPFVIKPNQFEFEKIVGRELCGTKEITDAIKELLELGVCNLLVSRGGDGIIYGNKKGTLVARVPKVDVVSTVSAGDSTLSGFIAGKNLLLDDSECLRLAAAFGTAAVTTEGVIPPTKDVIDSLRPSIEVESI